jgi:hypothetical protein
MESQVTDTPVESKPDAPQAQPEKAPEAKVPGPADELRNIQGLLANGIFPGNVAPAVVKGYNFLEAMIQKIEKEAKV